MAELGAAIEAKARETGFSGVVRVDAGDRVAYEGGFGWADRRHQLANRPDTIFGIASGAKGLTGLTVMSLVESGHLALDAPARAWLAADLPLIRDDVTIEQLLSHRSGIGDYLDESDGHATTDYVMPVPVHQLADAADYLAVLDGHETAFAPDAQFSYNNGAFVVLAIIAERAGGQPYHDLVESRVCAPAGLVDTVFERSDELPPRAAVGYLGEGPRTNVLHLPVRGVGDGGVYTTAADVSALWTAVFAGRVVSAETLAEMVRPRSTDDDGDRYGLGFWLHETSDAVLLVGHDAGVSFWSAHAPRGGLTCTVISNTSEGAWPLATLLYEELPA